MNQARRQRTNHAHELEDEPQHEFEPVVRYAPKPPFGRIPVRAVCTQGLPEHGAAKAR